MKIFGLFGEKLSHSLSPAIHNMLYQALSIEATYSLFEIQPQMLSAAVMGVKALNINGVNVTIPYKLKVMSFLDSVSEEAKRIGAVNTIHYTQDQLKGYNTDYIGFGKMLDRFSIATQQKTAVILGTGGAAKSAVTYFEDHGISDIYLVSRAPEEVTSFDPKLYRIIGFDKLQDVEKADLLVNCTPCGMHPKIDYSPIEEATVERFETVIDLIYNPSTTKLLEYANRNGSITVNGLFMLVAQAAAAVELWIGQAIDNSIVESVYQRLKQKVI